MTHEEFEARMQVFHIAMQLSAINCGGLAMGAAFNPDPKAAALCLSEMPKSYDLARSVLADIKRDWETSQADRGAKP